jgi:hypothetical protein
MLTFSRDPAVAERQMEALIFSLTTFGYIDGDFDEAEKELVAHTIDRLVERRVDAGVPNAKPEDRAKLITRFTRHFREKLDLIDEHVRELFHEPLAGDEDRDTFVHAKLKQRCFEIFSTFDRDNQVALLESVDELIAADGELHPAEMEFRDELMAMLTNAFVAGEVSGARVFLPRTSVLPTETLEPEHADHTIFAEIEHHYSLDPDMFEQQIESDLDLVARTMQVIDAQRAEGDGKLNGKSTVHDIAPGASFLDGWTHVLMPEAGRAYELTVLGDLHGCYSCLKASVMQTRFFEKVDAYRADPENEPNPKLVFLGDYIDRGIFSLNGVLRSVMQLLTTAPEHVYALRGNHEYYIEHKGQIYGGVKPAEAIDALKPHVATDVFRAYMSLFDRLPNVLLFDRTIFVHAGIPRDRVVKEKWRDLSTLNDKEMRFQMMWSDPSVASVIPAALQGQSTRFPFGRLQLASFLARIGCHTMVRGHEKVNEGFRRVYDDGSGLLITLFSAGGAQNRDLPANSSYRAVTPMGLTLRRSREGETTITPFEIDWATYNHPERNAFFRDDPET